MTTATDHKNNLNSSALKKNYARTLRVETIANSAGGTAEVAIVAQPSTGFLNTRFYPDGSPTEDTEDCLGRITVGLPPGWPKFNANPEQENREQIQRWSLNTVPSWSNPPLAIANKYHDHQPTSQKAYDTSFYERLPSTG